MVVANRNKPTTGGTTPIKPALKTALTPAAGGSTPAQHAGTSNTWSSPRTNALKSALASARNPSQAPRPNSVMMVVPPTPSDVAGRMNNLSLKASDPHSWRATGTYDPSLGPTQSTMTTKWCQSNAPSRATDRTRRQAFTNAVCKISNYTRRDFKLGDVISAPFHVANTNPHVKPDDERLTRTCEGHAYSKRRMMVVLFVHHYDLFCLPLFSFSGRGLTEKPDHIKTEYVCMKNAGAENFVNHGVHPPVEIQAHRPVTDSTTVHPTGGLRVGCNEDIARVGRLTEKSYFRLVEIWEKVVEEAQNQAW